MVPNIMMYTNYTVHSLAFFFVFSYIKKKKIVLILKNIIINHNITKQLLIHYLNC